MKKVIKFLIISIFLVLPIKVFASGSVSVSTTSISITEGESASFTITANNSAGRVDIFSSNQVVAQVSETSIFLDNNSKTISITNSGSGSATITIRLVDVATFDREELNNEYTINVVAKAKTPDYTNDVDDNPPSGGGNTNPPTPSTPTNPEPTPTPTPEPTKSSNTDLKSLTVSGYSVKKENDKYTLTVPNNVDKIKISAQASDSKSKIDGIGEKKLSLGENSFNIVVTAEDGSKKTYNLVVTRKKDKYYLSDLDALLSSNDNIITLKENDVVTEVQLNKIKASKKTIYLNKYNDKNELLYSYIIDGNKLNEVSKFSTEITSEFIKSDKIGLNVETKDKIPQGIKVKYNISTLNQDSKKNKLYEYNGTDLNLIENAQFDNDFVTFDVSSTKYFIGSLVSDESTAKTNLDIFVIISIAEFLIILLLIIYIIRRRVKVDKSKNSQYELRKKAIDRLMMGGIITENGYNINQNGTIQTINDTNGREQLISSEMAKMQNNNQNLK